METIAMNISVIGLVALVGLAVCVFLVVLGLITVLTNPKTRDAARITLGVLAALVLAVVLVGGLLAVTRAKYVAQRHEVIQAEMQARQAAIEAEHKARQLASGIEIDESTDKDEVESADVTESDAATESEDASPDATSEETDGSSDEEAAAETPPEEPEAADSTELNVPISVAAKPEWVGRKPFKQGSAYCWPVVTDPRETADEATDKELPQVLERAVADYIRNKLELGSLAANRVHLDSEFVLTTMVEEGDIWIEPVDTTWGQWSRVHVLVRFDHKANTLLEERWTAVQLTQRLWTAGTLLCGVLFFLSLVYCYLKLDAITSGSKRGLLRFAAIVVILGLAFAVAGVAAALIA